MAAILKSIGRRLPKWAHQFLVEQYNGVHAGLRRLPSRCIQPYLHARRLARRRRILSRAGHSTGPVALFMVPEAGIRPYFAAHAILARTLQDRGRTALLLTCHGILPTCSIKINIADSKEKAAACLRCRQCATIGLHRYELPDIPIDHLIDEADLRDIDEIVANHSELWDEFHYGGIAFGTAAISEARRALN